MITVTEQAILKIKDILIFENNIKYILDYLKYL